MFYAKVLVGNCKTMNPDSTLRMPPLVDAQKSQTLRHDSIQGHTGGSDVFMIYSNNLAYPEYLITYT